MTFRGPDPDLSPSHHHQHHLLDWLDDSMPFLSTFLDDTYTGEAANEITSYEWWTQEENQANMNNNASLDATPIFNTFASSNNSQLLPQAELSKKRKQSTSQTTPNKTAAPQIWQRIAGETGNEGDRLLEEEGEVNKKMVVTGRKAQGKGNAGSSNGGSKEARWAEQLLNPCAAAIEAANVSRVQHLFCVLQELQSFTGDANHRLAAHGLRTLANHFPFAGIGMPAAPATFATTEPKLFRSAIIKFHEVSPWFAFPNAVANASILQTLSFDPSPRTRSLHVVDIGVSHGIQWPTLLDALARRPCGAPPLVRLTVAVSAVPPGPFSAAPPGYDFRSHLLRYAKSIDLNLQIDRVDDISPGSLALTGGEILVICAQFRAGHGSPNDRTAFLRSVRELNPDLVVLSDIEGSSSGEVGFPAGFARRAELMWRFLDSTSAAFKGRDCAERRLVEGEAARILETPAEAEAEARERWRERMDAVGFREEPLGEEVIDSGRSLLRKYDSNWEMRASPAEAVVALGWKGQPVSFCSLWKPHRRS
ncbi:hypothetical protein Cni_G11355 [Canna indica]|uniref:Nodulation signaling pathway 1-like protein n=1 Tax=Canna indica TaxID=4628 RepID=A0AAQ3KBM5_9LILI|nr:hypothetical protein Cni_G11355 [Canna indica]